MNENIQCNQWRYGMSISWPHNLSAIYATIDVLNVSSAKMGDIEICSLFCLNFIAEQRLKTFLTIVDFMLKNMKLFVANLKISSL